MKDAVGKGGILIEYTGNQISGHDLRRMNRSYDHHGIHPDLQTAVPSEGAVIDPRRIDNFAHKVNHHCEPNAELSEKHLGKKLSVFVVALHDVQAGEEIYIDYMYKRGGIGSVQVHVVDGHDEFEEAADYDMEIGAKRNVKLPIIRCTGDSPNCCLTLSVFKSSETATYLCISSQYYGRVKPEMY